MVAAAASNTQLRRAPTGSGNLYDILDLILDKGIVIDAFVRVSLVGIELLTVDLRVVIASVDTYIRYAEAVQRLQLYERSGSKRLTDMMGGDKSSGDKGAGGQVGKPAPRGIGRDEGAGGSDEDGKGMMAKIGQSVSRRVSEPQPRSGRQGGGEGRDRGEGQRKKSARR